MPLRKAFWFGSLFLFFGRAGTVFAVAAALMFLRRDDDFASLGRNLKAFFSFEKNALRGQQAEFQSETEDIASERAEMMQMIRVNKDLFPCRHIGR